MHEIKRVAAKNTVFEMFLVLIQNGTYVLRDRETIEKEYEVYKANLSEKRRLASANALAVKAEKKEKQAKAAESAALLEEAEEIVSLAINRENALEALQAA